MKTCTLCKIQKPTTDFGKHSQKPDGLSSWCLQCSREKARVRLSQPSTKKQKQEYDKKRYLDPVVQENAVNRARKHYESNKKERKAKVAEWQKQNKDKVLSYKKANKYKRREIISNSTVSAREFLEWENTQLKVCVYCGVSCSDAYQIDHIEPLSRGGTHDLNNLVIACPTCNREKSNTPMIVWIARKQLVC